MRLTTIFIAPFHLTLRQMRPLTPFPPSDLTLCCLSLQYPKMVAGSHQDEGWTTGKNESDACRPHPIPPSAEARGYHVHFFHLSAAIPHVRPGAETTPYGMTMRDSHNHTVSQLVMHIATPGHVPISPARQAQDGLVCQARRHSIVQKHYKMHYKMHYNLSCFPR